MTSTRRGFFAGVAASGAVRLAGAAPASDTLKLGVATYSLRHFSRTQAIEMIRALKTPYVSIKEFHLRYASSPEELAAGRKEFESAGLKILSGGNIELQEPKELRRRFEYARMSGMPMMVCAPAHATLAEVEKLVKEYGIRAAIHNHGPEDNQFPTPESVLKAVKDMDPRMGLCLDIGHTARAGADILESVHQAGPRLFDIHIKDLKDTSRDAESVPVGEGVLPIVPLLRLLRKINYQGGVMLEYETDEENPLPGMKQSFAFMRGALAGLAG